MPILLPALAAMRRWLWLPVVLLALMHSSAAFAKPQYLVYARITLYDCCNPYTYTGDTPIQGVTAGCSWDIPLYSTIVLPDGSTRICDDRGANDGVERVDLYVYDASGAVTGYADSDWVEILPPQPTYSYSGS